jgi:hypothetical protein
MATDTSPARVARRLDAPVLRLDAFKLKPRHRWFSSSDPAAPDGWFGPCRVIEDALMEAFAEGADECWVAQGRKRTKAEMEDECGDYTWEVDALLAFKVTPQNAERQARREATYPERSGSQED